MREFKTSESFVQRISIEYYPTMSIVNNQSGWGVIQRDICIQRMRFRCLDELKAWNGRLVYGSFISALTHIVHALACMTLPLHGLLFMLFIPMHDASMCVHVCLSVHRSTRLFSSVLHFFGLGHRWACVCMGVRAAIAGCVGEVETRGARAAGHRCATTRRDEWMRRRLIQLTVALSRQSQKQF